MTTEKSKEDIKYYFFPFMKISNATITSKHFIEFQILRYGLHCSNIFGARLENSKTNKRDKRGVCVCVGRVLITAEGGGGVGFFFKKNKQGGSFVRHLRVCWFDEW